jgi:hypothetical protein
MPWALNCQAKCFPRRQTRAISHRHNRKGGGEKGGEGEGGWPQLTAAYFLVPQGQGESHLARTALDSIAAYFCFKISPFKPSFPCMQEKCIFVCLASMRLIKRLSARPPSEIWKVLQRGAREWQSWRPICTCDLWPSALTQRRQSRPILARNILGLSSLWPRLPEQRQRPNECFGPRLQWLPLLCRSARSCSNRETQCDAKALECNTILRMQSD